MFSAFERYKVDYDAEKNIGNGEVLGFVDRYISHEPFNLLVKSLLFMGCVIGILGLFVLMFLLRSQMI